MGERICAEIIDMKSLTTICKMDGMPSRRTVMYWLNRHQDFKELYDRACVERSEGYAEEIVDIADDGSNDWMKTNDPDNPGWKLNGEHVQRSKLRLEARKWICSKMKPHKFGEKVEHTIAHRQAAELSEVDLERIAAGGSAGTAEPSQSPKQPSSVH
jgi:hypothetical protein